MKPQTTRWAGLGVGAMSILAAAAYIAHVVFDVPLTRPGFGVTVSDVGLAVQLATMVCGVLALAFLPPAIAPTILLLEGAVCVLAFGVVGATFLVALLVWWLCLGTGGRRWTRLALGLVLLAAMLACAWTSASPAALLFSATFSMRLVMFAYERWQHDFAPVSLRSFLVYMLLAPLILIPPFLLIIPRFGDFEHRVRPGLDRSRIFAIARHALLAGTFGGLRFALYKTGIHPELLAPSMFVRLLANIVEFAALAHLFMALLLAHGVEERSPIDEPLRSTTFVELWNRMSVHLKDAQVFLFFTPALLRLRRMNRYVAITLATFWTMVVGNTVLHIVARYCFLADPWERISWALVANTVMAIALSVQLCIDERRSRGELPARTLANEAVGWTTTMTIAATVATM